MFPSKLSGPAHRTDPRDKTDGCNQAVAGVNVNQDVEAEPVGGVVFRVSVILLAIFGVFSAGKEAKPSGKPQTGGRPPASEPTAIQRKSA